MGAFEGTKLIGIASYLRETSPKEKHKGGVYGVYVAKAYRRKGAGRALIATVIERAKEDETLEQILISVATHQTSARNLYRSLGFEPWGVEPRALKVGAEYVDEEHMLLAISRETAAG
jgi:ribosomal protein S18 acetylase RimI-like enzyme